MNRLAAVAIGAALTMGVMSPAPQGVRTAKPGGAPGALICAGGSPRACLTAQPAGGVIVTRHGSPWTIQSAGQVLAGTCMQQRCDAGQYTGGWPFADSTGFNELHAGEQVVRIELRPAGLCLADPVPAGGPAVDANPVTLSACSQASALWVWPSYLTVYGVTMTDATAEGQVLTDYAGSAGTWADFLSIRQQTWTPVLSRICYRCA